MWEPHLKKCQIKAGWSWRCCRVFCIEWESGTEWCLFNLASMRITWRTFEEYWFPGAHPWSGESKSPTRRSRSWFFFLSSSGDSSGKAGGMTTGYGNSCSPHIDSVWRRMRYKTSVSQPCRRRAIPTPPSPGVPSIWRIPTAWKGTEHKIAYLMGIYFIVFFPFKESTGTTPNIDIRSAFKRR